MDNPFGKINVPTTNFGSNDNPTLAIGNLVNLGFRLLIIGAGIFAVINFILAGYSFLSAGDDPKKVASAWSMIWQSILGLAVAAGAFILAAVINGLIFGGSFNILKPTLTF